MSTVLVIKTTTEAKTTTAITTTISGKVATDKAETEARELTGQKETTGIGRWTDNSTTGTRYIIE